MKSSAEQYYELFKGSDIAHGTFVVNTERSRDGKKQGTAKVVREPATVEMWDEHLRGGVGLGIIPITSQNKCQWGAIDIDQYDVDHRALVRALRGADIPAVVGRTKSGGAHVWLFLSEPVPAGDVQSALSSLAASLGYGGSEIFPKQSEILVDRGDTGNFLNMPYHGGANTTRYGFDDNGNGLTVEEFLPYAQAFVISPDHFYGVNFDFGVGDEELEDGPPCLQHLCRQGIGEGGRNNGLFNLGVYARLAHPETWERYLQEYNLRYLDPPLSIQEVAVIIRQLKKKEYFYRCEDQPIKPYCDKETCKQRKHGVGSSASNDLTSLTKIDGDPPIWILSVDGRRVELSTEALTNQAAFQRECVAQINVLPTTVSTKTWHVRIKALLDNVTVVEVPPDATEEGEFHDLLHTFVVERARGDCREDILNGVAVWEGDRVYFQVKDIRRHLKLNDFTGYSANKVTLALRELGAEKTFWRMGTRGIHVWSLPQEFFEERESNRIPAINTYGDEII